MAAREVALQSLIGKMLIDVEGEKVGRIEDVRAEMRDGECVVVEYLVGVPGVAARLALTHLLRLILAASGWERKSERSPIVWSLVDLSDAAHPKLRCRKSELPK